MLVSRISPVELGTDPARAPDGIISGYSPGTRPLATYTTRHLCQMREAAAFLSNSFAGFCSGDLLTFLEMSISKGGPGGKAIGAAAKWCFLWRENDAGMLKVR
jgi:hypothetical protein